MHSIRFMIPVQWIMFQTSLLNTFWHGTLNQCQIRRRSSSGGGGASRSLILATVADKLTFSLTGHAVAFLCCSTFRGPPQVGMSKEAGWEKPRTDFTPQAAPW